MEKYQAFVFILAFMYMIVFYILVFIVIPLVKKNRNNDIWIYGTCANKKARKHKKHKNVQFVLWKAGQQGHKEDYWINFDSSWWKEFKEDVKEIR